MRIFKVEVTILGTNDNPETRVERIIANTWEEVMELMARIARDTGFIMTEVKILETRERPFDYKTLKAA